jgi:hypothetical protein
MMKKPSTEVTSFGPFLEAMNARGSANKVSGTPLRLASLLAGSAGPVPIDELMRRSDVPFSEFVEALKSSQEIGVVELTRIAGNDVVQLTPSGKSLLHLAGSAFTVK